MAITPNTDIRLLKTPFTIDNKNQLTFTNKETQAEYFLSLPYVEKSNCTYQRKDNVIRFPAHIDSIIEYNYVIYRNNNYSDKWFYAFITNMRYVNDNMTEVEIKTDVFQTWQFDINYKKSFVEREHVTDDTIGLHTIDENLNVGEVIEEKEIKEVSLSDMFYIVIQCDYDPKTQKEFSYISCYNGQLFPSALYVFPYDLSGTTSEPFKNIINFMRDIQKDKTIDVIRNMYVVPDGLIDSNDLELVEMEDYNYYRLNYTFSAKEFNIDIDKQHTFNDFIPKNNKCFVYPYNYLFVSNNNGNHNVYKYEDFNQEKATFKISLAMQVGCSGRLFPLNYKRNSIANDESLPLAKYPTFSWSGDAFINWLTQNAVNVATDVALSTGNTIFSGMEGNIQGAVMNPLNTIAKQIGNFYSASLLPNIVGGQNTGDVNFSAEQNTFIFRCMRAKTEFLKSIDNYFSMFGYKVNEMKIPNITGRPNWNYVKTSDINIIGDIPQMDLAQIKLMFDNGVTFWHNPSTFLDYSQNNKN